MYLEVRILLERAMAMKLRLRAAMFAACMALAMVSGGARADEVPLITGEHWTQSTEQLKKVYLIGVANVIQVEMAYHAASPPSPMPRASCRALPKG